MDRPGDQFLARAGFAPDEHRESLPATLRIVALISSSPPIPHNIVRGDQPGFLSDPVGGLLDVLEGPEMMIRS